MPANRNILALAIGCLAVVGIAAAIAYDRDSRSLAQPSVATISSPIATSASLVSLDSSFYSGGQASSTSAASSTPQADATSDASALIASAPIAPAKPAVPTITARAYLVGNVLTGQIYLEQDASSSLPVASMSKLVTAIAATDLLTPTTTIEITPEEAALPPDGSGLQAGEKFALQEILYPMLLDSSNIAAEAIASTTDRARFLYLMSSYAWEIGMPTAYFADASGLSADNVASAHDIFALARYLYKFRPDILAITRTAHASIATTTDHGAHEFDSIHPFINDPRFIGGKTGNTTAAGGTMLTMLNIGGQPIAFIVLHSDPGVRQEDTQLLIDKVTPLLASP